MDIVKRALYGSVGDKESVRKRHRLDQKESRLSLVALPKDGLAWVLCNCDAESVVGLRTTCRGMRLSCEEWAKQKVARRGWRMADGIETWVERLGTSVCVFDPDEFREIGSHGTGRTIRAQAAPGLKGATCSTKHGDVAATFSKHASAVNIVMSGRYLLSGHLEPSLLEDGSRSRRRFGGGEGSSSSLRRGTKRKWSPERSTWVDRMEEPRPKRRELAFQVNVRETDAGGKSSIYVGVAERKWTEGNEVGQAVRSQSAWLMDVRRGRFVHNYPDYDNRVSSLHGADRARLYASTDDVIQDGDVLGVRVKGDSVEFFKNGARLAFAAGGAAHPVPLFEDDRGGENDDDERVRVERQRIQRRGGLIERRTGWGRPVPRGVELVPVVEVHARLNDTTTVGDPSSAASRLALEMSAWDQTQGTTSRRARLLVDTQQRREEKATAIGQVLGGLADDKKTKYFRSLAIDVLPHLSGIVGTIQATLDIYGLSGDSSFAPCRNFADAFSLSLAVSSVWKCHFYDKRRPRRSRRGLRSLLRGHLCKCLAVASCVSALTVAAESSSPSLSTSKTRRPVFRAVSSFLLWLVCELVSEVVFRFASRRGSHFAEDLRSFPTDGGGEGGVRRRNDNDRMTPQSVLKVLFFFCVMPGAASILISLASTSFTPENACSRSTLFLEAWRTSDDAAASQLRIWKSSRSLVTDIDQVFGTNTVEIRVLDEWRVDDPRAVALPAHLPGQGPLILACHSKPCLGDLIDTFSSLLDEDVWDFVETPLSFDRETDDSNSAFASEDGSLRVAAALPTARHTCRTKFVYCWASAIDENSPTSYFEEIGRNMDLFAQFLVYLFLGLWMTLALLSKISLLMFGVTALCGFEDFDIPGWLL